MNAPPNQIEAQTRRPATESAPLRRGLEEAPATNHYALLYESRREQLDAVLSFVQVGLENEERCLYIADEHSVGEIRTELERLDADVCGALENDQLRIRSADETYLAGGFDPDRMLESLLELAEESVADGYTGLRVTGEMSWVLESETDFDAVLEYEARYEDTAEAADIVALCQYNKLRFDADAIIDIIQTHPKLIYRSGICDNPYYTPPAEFLGADQPEAEATRMLETIADLTDARKAVRAREQRLQVVNRVLRHNLRNDMNVIQGHADRLEKETTTAAAQASAEQIIETADQLLEIAEKASHIEQTLTRDAAARREHPLHRVIGDAEARLQDDDVACTIEREFDRDTHIEATAGIALAFEQLFEVVAAHSAGEPTIEIGVAGSTSGGLSEHELTVRIIDGALPAAEVEAVMEGGEHPLVHSSGLGLWLVHWLIDQSGGDLRFQCEGDQCVELTILLPAGTPAHQQRRSLDD